MIYVGQLQSTTLFRLRFTELYSDWSKRYFFVIFGDFCLFVYFGKNQYIAYKNDRRDIGTIS